MRRGRLTRWIPVWRRNFGVWRKLARASLVGNLADPMFYLLGLGYGLSHLLPSIGGMPYLAFLAAGTLCYSTMNTATYEGLYSAYTRMQEQKTWEGMTFAPLGIEDVVLGETLWAATKSLFSGLGIIVVIDLLGIIPPGASLALVPVVVLTGCCFAGLALAFTTVASGYDVFLFYFTLVVTPMILLGGVFYPSSALPAGFQAVAAWLPLTHAINLARPILSGRSPDWLAHAPVLVGYGIAGLCLAVRQARRRLMR